MTGKMENVTTQECDGLLLKDNKPIVFGTVQTYLKDANERLLLTTKAAEKMGVQMGLKLVRGAYMSRE